MKTANLWHKDFVHLCNNNCDKLWNKSRKFKFSFVNLKDKNKKYETFMKIYVKVLKL